MPLTRSLRRLFFGILFVLLLVLAVNNRQSVTLSFFPLPYEIDLPLFLFGLVMLLGGYIWGGFTGISKRFSAHYQVKREKQRAAALSNEVTGLRAQQAAQESVEPSVAPMLVHE